MNRAASSPAGEGYTPRIVLGPAAESGGVGSDGPDGDLAAVAEPGADLRVPAGSGQRSGEPGAGIWRGDPPPRGGAALACGGSGGGDRALVLVALKSPAGLGRLPWPIKDRRAPSPCRHRSTPLSATGQSRRPAPAAVGPVCRRAGRAAAPSAALRSPPARWVGGSRW